MRARRPCRWAPAARRPRGPLPWPSRSFRHPSSRTCRSPASWPGSASPSPSRNRSGPARFPRSWSCSNPPGRTTGRLPASTARHPGPAHRSGRLPSAARSRPWPARSRGPAGRNSAARPGCRELRGAAGCRPACSVLRGPRSGAWPGRGRCRPAARAACRRPRPVQNRCYCRAACPGNP